MTPVQLCQHQHDTPAADLRRRNKARRFRPGLSVVTLVSISSGAKPSRQSPAQGSGEYRAVVAGHDDALE